MMVPRETSRGRLYTASAVAWALALFGVEHVSAAQVRRRTSPWSVVGATARWGGQPCAGAQGPPGEDGHPQQRKKIGALTPRAGPRPAPRDAGGAGGAALPAATSAYDLGGAVRSVEADMTEPAEDHVDCHACFEKVHGRPCAGKCAAIPVVPCARGALHRLYPRETHA
jgi:hypothetical protein